VSNIYSLNLVAFLYTLMRDEITPGTVAGLVKDTCRNFESIDFTNKHLEAYAREIADKLVLGGPLDPQAESSYHRMEL
jgi:hypothetical protein